MSPSVDDRWPEVLRGLRDRGIETAAVVLEGPKALHEGAITNELMGGVVASAISGWLAISILMRYVSRHSYGIFAFYRVALGIAVLAVIYVRG